MSATHARLIVILLCAILAVLLFGREAVFDSASTFLWVVGGSCLLVIVWLLARAFFVEVPKEVISDLKDLRQTGKPWIAEAILMVGLPFGVVWIGGLVAEKYLGYVKQTPYTDIAGLVWFVVFALFLTAMLLRWVRSLFRRKQGDSQSFGAAAQKVKCMEERVGHGASAVEPIYRGVERTRSR